MAILKNGKYTVTFTSNVEFLEEVEDITSKIAAEVGFDESSADDLSIAVTELFNNAIHHGNNNDETKNVSIRYIFNGNKLCISVQDEGPGFIPDKIKDPLAPENLLADSGRGIYLVKMLMDRMDFNITPGGSEIIITKSLSK